MFVTRNICLLTLLGVVTHSPVVRAADELLDAMKRQEVATVARILKSGADVNIRQADGATALHWAAYWDDIETAGLLIKAGAHVNSANDFGVTPLILASGNGSSAMVSCLLDAGATPNVSLSTGESPLMTASRTGNADVVRLLLKRGAQVNVSERSRGQNALMWAVSQQHADVVRVLLEHGANLHARSHARRQLVNTAGNAKPEGNAWVEQGGFTPLLFAARNGNAELARTLLSAGADANDVATSGASALTVAAHSGHTEVSMVLLQAGADPNAAAAGYSALHAAILRGDAPLVQALLSKGADPNAPLLRGTEVRRVSADWHLNRDLIGATPFWLAAKYAEPGIMRLLAAHGADASRRKGTMTPLLVAIEGVTYGAQIGTPSDRRGRPYYAGGAVSADSGEEARLTLESVQAAVELGVDVNATDDHGNTALHAAASRGLPSVAEYLVQQGAQLDVKNAGGDTPLALALKGPRPGLEGTPDAGPYQETAALLRRLGAREGQK